MKKKEKRVVSKTEKIIAAIVLAIGVGLILAYTFSAKEYIDSETEAIQRTLDVYMIEGDGQQFEDYDNSLEIKTDENGNQYIDVLKLDASTSLAAIEGGGYKILEHGDLNVNETIVIDDDGNSIEMKLSESVVISYLNGKPINTFMLDEHTIEIKDNCYYADGIAVMIPEKATTEKSSSKTENSTSENTTSVITSAQSQLNVNTSQTTNVNTVSQSRTNKITNTSKKATVRATKTTTKITTKKPKKTTTKKVTTTQEESYVSPNADLNEVVNLVNQERASRGLPALKMKLVLNKMAQVRAKESAKFFSHTRPDGTSAETIMADYSVSYTMFGENLASGAATPKEVVDQWMNSPPHKAAILNKKFEYIGVGYYYLKNDPYNSNYYWSQIFFTP